jgi:hypothetical protein
MVRLYHARNPKNAPESFAMPFLRPVFLIALVLSGVLFDGVPKAYSQNVLTYHYNNQRTGLNSSETTLTLSNVNYTTFGKLFELAVDGKVDAQPLYLSAVPISGKGTHNLLIVATENDSVYAFDADVGTLIWHVSALLSGETASDDLDCDQITPTIGITATPVINIPTGSSGVIYVVAMSKDSSGNYHQRLHALNAPTGKELYGGPVAITAQYPGTGDNSSGGYVIFDPAQYAERSALLLLNGVVYLAWTSHCDVRPYTGWIMGYSATTLAQTTVLNITPNGNSGAIWGSGAGLAADTSGNIFFLDANGTFDATLTSTGFPSQGDYGNAFIRLTTANGLAVADYFETWNGQEESENDIDLGSGGALLLPNMPYSTGFVQLAVGAGKDTNIYIVNRNYMGKFNADGNILYQELVDALPNGMWAMPAYFNGMLYFGPVNEPLYAFGFSNNKLRAAPTAQTTNTFRYPGTTPSISANGTANGIVWATDNTSPALLRAFNATTLAQLYSSSQASDGRDQFGAGNKFIAPLIINGKVYVGTTTGVGAFGLLPQTKK